MNKRWSETGFSMIELMATLAVSGVVMLAVAELSKQQSENNAHARIISEINVNHNLMQQSLYNKEACGQLLDYAESKGSFNGSGVSLEGIGRVAPSDTTVEHKNKDKSKHQNSKSDSAVEDSPIKGVLAGKKGQYSISAINIKDSGLPNSMVKTVEIEYSIPGKTEKAEPRVIKKFIDVMAEKTALDGSWKCGNLVENTKKESLRKMCQSLGGAAEWIDNGTSYDCRVKEVTCPNPDEVPFRLTSIGHVDCVKAIDLVDMNNFIDPTPVNCLNKPKVSLSFSPKLTINCSP